MTEGPPTLPNIESKPDAQGTEMRYLEAYGYIFQNPNWAMNLLWGSLCQLANSFLPVVGIVGGILFIGYQFEIVESLSRKPRESYPDFDINRFSDYLVRGLWVFLTSLVLVVVMMVLMVPLVAIVIFGMIAVGGFAAESGDDSAASVLMILLMAISFIFSLVISLMASLVMTPVLLRAGLSQDIAQAFRFSWIKDFIKRTWLEMILVTLFTMVTGSLLLLIGMLACFIGMYPALAMLMMAQGHLYFQLYRLYLSRGGEPIPLKEPPAMAELI